ncbi:hypothetical protein [Salmonella enterica]|nr:hypothetical protein [Salmonella enterica]
MKLISYFTGSRKRSSTCLISSLLLPGMTAMGISLPGTAAMVEFGGDYTYSGTVTATGETIIGPVVESVKGRFPTTAIGADCPVAFKVEQCKGTLYHKNKDGSWRVESSLTCDYSQGVVTLRPASQIYFTPVYGDTYRMVFEDVRVKYDSRPTGVFHNSRCMFSQFARTGGTPTSGGGLEFRSSSGYVERIPAYEGGTHTILMPPTTAVNKTYLEYPTLLQLRAAPDGSARGQAVTVVGRNAQAQFSVYGTTGNHNSGSSSVPGVKPQLIKKDGSQCVYAREGESCDIYFPPGSVAPGQYYNGWVSINVTVK